jgi:hypothetical protein
LSSCSFKGKKENIKNYAKKLYESRSYEEKASEEAEIIEILAKKDIIDEKGIVLTKDIAVEFNSNRNEKEQWKTRSIGWLIRRRGCDKIHTKKGNGWLIDNERLKNLQEIYGITETQENPYPEKVQQLQKVHHKIIEDAFLCSCFLCQKPIPHDLAHCTYLDGKPIHLECYKKLTTQKRTEDYSENLLQEFETSTDDINFNLPQQEGTNNDC